MSERASWHRLEVLRAGLQTTVQDLGRRARALGIPASGAADPVALRLANALVGNAPRAAALELTLSGPTLRFGAGAVVALCGAPFEAALDGKPLALWRAVQVQAGQTLSIGGTPRGMRAVLAVRGGLLGQEAFGSRSTDLRAGFGGLGRALEAGDTLEWAAPSPTLTLPAAPFRVWVAPDLHTLDTRVLRVLPTLEASPDLLKSLTSTAFTVSKQADRMGVRLAESLSAPHDPSRQSLPNLAGMVQLPPDGKPILLLPDAGTHGGYPTPLVVIGADLPKLGQLRPHDRLFFRVVSRAQARAALAEQERALRSAEAGLRLLWS